MRDKPKQIRGRAFAHYSCASYLQEEKLLQSSGNFLVNF